MKIMAVLSMLVLGVVVSAWVGRPIQLHQDANPYHTRVFVEAYGGLPDSLNSLFTGSGKCAGCHATDPNYYASLVGQTYPAIPIPNARDVNPTDMWRSTMMANAAKDPFWRAKVAHEVAVNPDHQAALEDKCTACHAPLGNFAAAHDGIPNYTMEMLVQDSLALDGVSCVACHQQSADSSGMSFSGQLKFDSAVIYGPYGMGEDDPPIYTLPMLTYSGYTPMHGQHILESTVCADCHTLLTHTADMEGNLTGEMFVEQATYHEWVNSAFSGQGIAVPEGADTLQGTCQTCHMPRVSEPVIISSGYSFLAPRTPYGLHTLVGANTAMLEILQGNIDLLGITATSEHFDSTIALTRALLTEKAVKLEVSSIFDSVESQAWVEVKLSNKAGHKFPSGYPSRRAWVELIATYGGDTIFHSGKLDPSGARIIGSDEVGLSSFEPHHDVITSDSQVQIYELVAGNVDLNPTNILERAAVTLKDNRLVPVGFSTSHSVYDTTRIEGAVLMDPNFNFSSGLEGSGTDNISYSIPVSLLDFENIELEVNVWYQSMPPRWVEAMFDWTAQPISDFQAMYEEHGAAAELVVADFSTLLVVSDIEEPYIKLESVVISPNPAINGVTQLRWTDLEPGSIFEVFDSSGSRIQAGALEGSSGEKMLTLPATRGMYLVRVHYNGLVKSLRIVRP